MSTWKVVYTKGAEQNLRDIFEYIAFTLLEPDVAAGQANRIMDEIAKLDHMPFRFQEYEHEPWRSKGLRYVPVDHYLVFYYPHEAHKVVSIMRIMYGGRDVQAQLRLVDEAADGYEESVSLQLKEAEKEADTTTERFSHTAVTESLRSRLKDEK